MHKIPDLRDLHNFLNMRGRLIFLTEEGPGGALFDVCRRDSLGLAQASQAGVPGICVRGSIITRRSPVDHIDRYQISLMLNIAKRC